MNTIFKQSLTLVAVIAMLSSVGCSSLSSNKSSKSFAEWMPWSKKKDVIVPYPNPVKMATTWTPDTLVQTGRTPTRGFGGRIFFYDEKSRPVPVEGTLVVHGFDEESSNPEKTVKRFEFTPEQFTRHFSQSDLGASYSVWIPWDAIGGEPRRISLVASFKPLAVESSELTADGKPYPSPKLVQGVPSTIMLPGEKSRINQIAEEQSRLSPQYQEYKQATAGINTRTSGLTTTTIERRRSPLSNRKSIPSISVPGTQRFDGDSGIAQSTSVPSQEIRMASRPTVDTVLPASATMPVR
ncbi:hypothetical protein [Novipirellula artificiosorum]|uniref:Uncharacterized protein n=1 Tax=Novipirellula artificiosorum TaxID=2528016 RepID=A0A5C6E207_9BACT|nr:hypothetical protein [Novipirellula artificiosorum]TWU42524.1 hypothetical protein Poly41_08210 [Novipirellula artificiosorum]